MTVSSPENKEIISTCLVVSGVGALASFLGIGSDVRNLPEIYTAAAVTIRSVFGLLFFAGVIVAWRRPEVAVRYHTHIVLAGALLSFVYLTWLDVASGDYTRSAYNRSLIVPSIAVLVFRRMGFKRQTAALVFALVFYGTSISFVYEVSLFGARPADRYFQDLMNDLFQILLVLLLVFQRYKAYQNEEVRLREALKNANDVKSEIIAKVNHELQVPLLGLLANLDSLEKGLGRGDQDRMQRVIDRSYNYCIYQRTLVNNMIYASTSDEHLPFHVDRSARASLQECYRKSAELVGDIHDGEIRAGKPPAVEVSCQNEILMIILINILSNCAEHSSNVELQWTQLKDTVVMHTKNSLVTPIDVDAIFQKWTSSRRDGTKPILGLGLNIARDLIQRSGGTIQAREESGEDGRRLFYLDVSLPCG